MSVNIRFNCLKFSYVVLSLLFLQPLFSQKVSTALEPLSEGQAKALGTEFSLVVATADSVLYQKTVGDMPPRTPYFIGAASQWLTTALIMQLVDEGKLSLDDRIDQYIPIFASYFKGYITVRHCLSHQTGIGNEGLFKLASFFEKNKFSSLEEAMPHFAKKEIHANTGEQVRYTNYGPFIAARIAEIVGKKQFAQLTRTKLFVPLGMRNTSFTTDDGSAPNPSFGAKSTAADYIKFLQMLLNGGKAGGKQILSEAAVEEMRRLQVAQEKIKSAPAAVQGFGLALGSWAVDDGSDRGQVADVLALPSLTGTWPLVDFSRRYAFVVVAKNPQFEQKADPYITLKNSLDTQLPVKK